jgi:hypothetical protein
MIGAVQKDAGAGSLRDDRVPEAPVFGDDTIRVTDVTERFFPFSRFFVIFTVSARTAGRPAHKTGKDAKT